MAFRFETHLNVPLKSKMKNVTLEQAAKYSVLHDLNDPKVNIASVTQDQDKVVIIKRMNTTRSYLYNNGLAQKGWYERVTIDRKDNSVQIDSFEDHWTVKTGPYVWKSDKWFSRADEKNKITFIRHLHWVNQLTRMQEMFWLPYNSYRLKSKLKGY